MGKKLQVTFDYSKKTPHQENQTPHFPYFPPSLQDTLDYSKKLRIKKTKLHTSLTFLLHCRDHNTIPRFLQFHHHIRSRAANRIYQRTSFALLRERIHHNRRELDNTSRELLEIHLRLGIQNSDAGGLPRRKHTIFRTQRKFAIKLDNV